MYAQITPHRYPSDEGAVIAGEIEIEFAIPHKTARWGVAPRYWAESRGAYMLMGAASLSLRDEFASRHVELDFGQGFHSELR